MTHRALIFSQLFLVILLSACSARLPHRAEFDDPERVWVSENGREYRLQRLDKASNRFEKMADGRLRWYPLSILEIEHETEAAFYVRQYVPVSAMPNAVAPEPVPVSPKNLGSLSVRTMSEGLPRSGQLRDQFAIADFNRDGRLDLALPPARKSTNMAPMLYLRQPDGSWQAWAQRRFPAQRFDYGAVASTDLNQDGHADLAVGMHILGVSAYVQDGAGLFREQSHGLPVPVVGAKPQLSSRQIAFQDWNQDGREDLLVMNEFLGQDPQSPYRSGALVFAATQDGWQAMPIDAALESARVLAQDRERSVLLLAPSQVDAGSWRIHERAGGKWHQHQIDGLPANSRVIAMAVQSRQGRAQRIAIAYQSKSPKSWWLHLDVLTQAGRQWQRQTLLRAPETRELSGLQFVRGGAGAVQLASVDNQGQIELWAPVDEASAWQRHDPWPAPDWRAGCKGYGLQAIDLDQDSADELIASFAGEPSLLPTGKDCTDGGGVDVLKLWP